MNKKPADDDNADAPDSHEGALEVEDVSSEDATNSIEESDDDSTSDSKEHADSVETSKIPDSAEMGSAPTEASEQSRSRRAMFLAVASFVVAGCVIGWLAWSRNEWVGEAGRFERASAKNLKAADDWESRASKLEASLGRSEKDVRELRVTQRRVAAAKARVEDQRAALQQEQVQLKKDRAALVSFSAQLARITIDFRACATGLDEVLGYVLNQEYASASIAYSTAKSQCNTANTGLDVLEASIR